MKIILTGATGMVGEGVLHECLEHPDIMKVLVVNRRPCGIRHAKLQEIIHQDFFDWHSIKINFSEYNACFFCLGVSSVGLKKTEYERLTYGLTLHIAGVIASANPDMIFCYISGAGTNSSEKGGSHWARVKGKTENALMRLPFKEAYMFRPGFLKATRGLNRTLPMYKYIGWLYPILKALFPNSASTLKELGRAMIKVAASGYDHPILEVKDILKLSKSS